VNICGHDDKKKLFDRLVKKNKLAHAYLFWGDANVGKYTFSKELALQLDSNSFETLTITQGDAGSIGIDQIRSAKTFLWKKPTYSNYRILIIDRLEKITAEAQNSLLKLVEEPPSYAILVGIITSPEILFPTLQSRFQKIYFSRLSSRELIKCASANLNIQKPNSELSAIEARGRPGLLHKWQNEPDVIDVNTRAKEFLRKPDGRSSFIGWLTDAEMEYEKQFRIDIFFQYLTAVLLKDPVKNCSALKDLNLKISNIKRFQTNKKLQLEALASIL